MTDRDEECEITSLVFPDQDGHLASKTTEASPLITPSICKVAATPSTPTSNKASSGGTSVPDTGMVSHGSFSSRSKLLGASLTPLGVPAGSSRFLYVNEKQNNLSRRPSILSDVGCRTPKDNKPTKLPNMKKDINPSSSNARDGTGPSTPPNTPSPSGWRELSESSDVSESKNDLNMLNLECAEESETSSELTTKALASGSENVSDTRTSSETLRKYDKPPRPLLTFNSNPTITPFNPNTCHFGSSSALNFPDHLNYLQATRSGYTGLRTVGSSTFIKSIWGNKQRNVQHHCFMSDITDVRQMEQALLQLLEDFHSGKLRAFSKDCSMGEMQGIREQQERLARLHFDLGAQQELFAPLSEEGLRANQENMQKLMGSLQQLSLSIEKLQLFSKDASQ
ncbi:UNVERIFIED_CONTAM: hypothetical protein PYX00_003634 [Menopon gallinae]|uniref:Uncharacterized protein n=1 Tax=Menopon gallinae TaxID=328185 RepID=A0AAW2I171_9NEOP